MVACLFLCVAFRFLSPLSAVPLVALSGFGLYELGFPVVGDSFWRFTQLNVGIALQFTRAINCVFTCLACKMRGDWAASNYPSSDLFPGYYCQH